MSEYGIFGFLSLHNVLRKIATALVLILLFIIKFLSNIC